MMLPPTRNAPLESRQQPANRHGSASPDVVVETWFLQCDRGRWKSIPAIREVVTNADHPHEYAAAAAARFGVEPDVVHSTSWRIELVQVVVTYIVVTRGDLPGTPFNVHSDHDHRCGTAPDHMGQSHIVDAVAQPRSIDQFEVLHHALHHLALLARSNAAVMAALSPIARESLRPLTPSGAGVLPYSGVATPRVA